MFGIDGIIAGRLDDTLDRKKGRLVHWFIVADPKMTGRVVPEDKELEGFRWVPLDALLESGDGKEGKAV